MLGLGVAIVVFRTLLFEVWYWMNLFHFISEFQSYGTHKVERKYFMQTHRLRRVRGSPNSFIYFSLFLFYPISLAYQNIFEFSPSHNRCYGHALKRCILSLKDYNAANASLCETRPYLSFIILQLTTDAQVKDNAVLIVRNGADVLSSFKGRMSEDTVSTILETCKNLEAEDKVPPSVKSAAIIAVRYYLLRYSRIFNLSWIFANFNGSHFLMNASKLLKMYI